MILHSCVVALLKCLAGEATYNVRSCQPQARRSSSTVDRPTRMRTRASLDAAGARQCRQYWGGVRSAVAPGSPSHVSTAAPSRRRMFPAETARVAMNAAITEQQGHVRLSYVAP